jgi:glycosyltransferase involved in cell wall biosynthesis
MKNNDNILMSICISVHNAENFLRRCLDSVVNQTLESKEIILVNNGSTDSSLKIMQEYKNLYPKIVRIYSQEDMGLAQGRQTGINHAQGEYIAFLDADDYVEHDAYEKMYASALKYDVDIVECQTLRGSKIIKSPYDGVHNTMEILKKYFSSSEIPAMLWMRIYRRSLFSKPVLPNFYVNNEDIFAFPCLLYSAQNIYYLQEPLHYYSTDNEQSVMLKLVKKSNSEIEMIENRTKTLYVIEHIRKYIGKVEINKNYAQEFNNYTAKVILNFCLINFNSLSIDEKIKIVCKYTLINKEDLNDYYRNFIYDNKIVEYLIKLFGFKKALIIHGYLKRIILLIKEGK